MVLCDYYEDLNLIRILEVVEVFKCGLLVVICLSFLVLIFICNNRVFRKKIILRKIE